MKGPKVMDEKEIAFPLYSSFLPFFVCSLHFFLFHNFTVNGMKISFLFQHLRPSSSEMQLMWKQRLAIFLRYIFYFVRPMKNGNSLWFECSSHAVSVHLFRISTCNQFQLWKMELNIEVRILIKLWWILCILSQLSILHFQKWIDCDINDGFRRKSYYLWLNSTEIWHINILVEFT